MFAANAGAITGHLPARWTRLDIITRTVQNLSRQRTRNAEGVNSITVKCALVAPYFPIVQTLDVIVIVLSYIDCFFLFRQSIM